MRALFLLVALCTSLRLHAQVTAAFSVDPTACLNQVIPLTNQSTGATTYGWDFCHRDLDAFPVATSVTSATSANILTSIQFVYEQGNWYGFVTGQNNSNLTRLNFGSSLDNTPTTTDLGTLGGALSGPKNIRFVKESGTWYGILINSSNNTLARLSFTTGIQNTPSIQVLGNLDSWALLYGLDVIHDGANWIAVVSDLNGNKLSLINFGSSIQNNPGAAQTTSVNNAALVGPLGVRIVQDQGNWFGVVALFSSHKVVRLSFGPTLGSTVAVDDLYAATSPTEVSLFKEGDTWQCHFSTLAGPVHHLRIGQSMNNSVGAMFKENLGSFAMFNNAIAFNLVRSQPGWYAFSADFSTSAIYRLKFTGTCSEISMNSSTSANPSIAYTQPATYTIELNAIDASGNISVAQHTTTVQNLQAPQPDFSTNKNCVAGGTTFQGIEVSGQPVSSWDWSFGDSGSGSGQNTTHNYGAASAFNVTLDIQAFSGCKNRVQKSVNIYNPPVADFALPAASPVCTNQSFTFNNLSTIDAGASPSWQWYVDGTPVSVTQNLSQSFPSAVSYQIDLMANVAGCQQTASKNFSVTTTGPLVDFVFDGICINGSTAFTDQTLGSVTGYQWSFGDGGIAATQHASHAYASPGTYNVSLQTTSAGGCNNSASKQVTIYALPVADFSVDLPPFSCAKVATPFQNLTTPPPDSQVNGWNWDFGDGSSSNQFQPANTYGTSGVYNVTLTATTLEGCMSVITKPVNISASPTPDFTATPACMNQITRFTDLSTGGVQSWVWQIGSSSFTTPNPNYVFTGPGNFPVSLTVTSANGCSRTKVVPMIVNPLPVQDFSMTNACANQETIFTDLTSSPSDPVSGWNWNIDGNAAAGNPATYTFQASGGFNVKLTTTHQSGCRYTLSRNVNVNGSPIADFTATPDRGDAPLTVQLINNSQQATSYLWRIFDKSTVMSTEVSPVYTFAALGNYSVELTAMAASGCVDIKEIPIQVITPQIDLALSDLTLVPDSFTGNLHVSVTVTNLSNVPKTNISLTLQLSGRANITEVFTTTLQPGAEAMFQFASSVASDESMEFVCVEAPAEKDLQPENNRVCVDLKGGETVFAPWPNPSSSEVHVDWIVKESAPATIRISDMMGRVWWEGTAVSQAGLNQVSVDVSLLPAGMYVVTVETGRSIQSSRFVRP